MRRSAHQYFLDALPVNPVTDQPVAVSLSRPARIRLELKNLLALALPIIIAQLATTAMGFVDAVMAGRVGPKDLAAVALGNSIWVPVFLLMTGTLLATTPKVAQRFGAGKHSEIGPIVRQALWLALVVGLIATSMLIAAEPVLHLMKVDPELIGPCMQYLHGIASGLPAVALYHVLRCTSDGIGRTRPAMVLGLCGLALNIPLNYIFIYGHFGAGPGRVRTLGTGLSLKRIVQPLRLAAVGGDQTSAVDWFADRHRGVCRVEYFCRNRPADWQPRRDGGGRASDRAERQLAGVHDPVLTGHGGHRACRSGAWARGTA